MQLLASIVGACVLFAFLPSGDSIMTSMICYQCKSWEDPGCWDIRQNDTKNKYAKFCDGDDIPVGAPVFCRTIYQKIRDGNGTERLWRKCGYEVHESKYNKSCYHNSDGHHEESVCQCFFDYCNAATATDASPFVLLACLAAGVFVVLRSSASL